ncbi:hypothetical protein F5Y15DRAFT_182189 [Xylariaceae sp. FL0016]|nr:hypothetical protein F5Y15DRAFT_182189 [Xylariaceae sp. FL0016]
MDPTYPKPSAISPEAVPEFCYSRLPPTRVPRISPYGDEWDVLWLGRCGMRSTSPPPTAPSFPRAA